MSDGGLVAASGSEWKEVSSIQSAGRQKTMPTTQASRPSAAERRLAAVRRARMPGARGAAVRGIGGGQGAHARPASSLKRDETTRRAKVAITMVPITTTTPAAEASPYS